MAEAYEPDAFVSWKPKQQGNPLIFELRAVGDSRVGIHTEQRE